MYIYIYLLCSIYIYDYEMSQHNTCKMNISHISPSKGLHVALKIAPGSARALFVRRCFGESAYLDGMGQELALEDLGCCRMPSRRGLMFGGDKIHGSEWSMMVMFFWFGST